MNTEHFELQSVHSVSYTHLDVYKRQLQDLVEMGAMNRTGERRHTRYWLHLQTNDAVEKRLEERSGG